MKIQVTFDTTEETMTFLRGLEATQAKKAEDKAPETPVSVPADPLAQVERKKINSPVTIAGQAIQPTSQQTTPQQSVPTTSHSYTAEDLQKAAITLVDKGMMTQLQGLLQQFGVNSLPDLPKDRYGDFATALRGMGAQI